MDKIDDSTERDTEAWSVKLTFLKPTQSSKKSNQPDSINKRILTENEAEKQFGGKNPFGCADIRYQQNESQASQTPGQQEQQAAKKQAPPKPLHSIDSIDSIEPRAAETNSVNTAALKTSLFPEDNSIDPVEVRDQKDERRMYPQREGECRVTTSLNRGVFWIRPVLADDVQLALNTLSAQINRFITQNHLESFSQLNRVPRCYQKCFARVRVNQVSEWYRCYIENVDTQKEKCTIRYLDGGSYKECFFNDLFPYRPLPDLDPLLQNFLAIRCCVLKQRIENDHRLRDEFDQLTNCVLKFKLIEQVQWNSRSKPVLYWHVHLYNSDGTLIFTNTHSLQKYNVLKYFRCIC